MPDDYTICEVMVRCPVCDTPNLENVSAAIGEGQRPRHTFDCSYCDRSIMVSAMLSVTAEVIGDR